MCETLGTEPIEEEIPVEPEDLYDETLQCFEIYEFLAPIWESGCYIGKDYSFLPELFKLFDMSPPEQVYTMYIIRVIDSAVSESISRKQAQDRERQEREVRANGKKASY